MSSASVPATASEKSGKGQPYSSLGPGRSPGVMKPDVLAFGGSRKEPFWILSTQPGQTAPTAGTSYASPVALRTAIGVRAYLGSIVQPIALKGLMIHHSNDSEHHCHEVGWGRIPSDIEELITCGPGTAHILYQGTLEAGKYLRARIPVPNGPIAGKVSISATFCYATETDPQDTVNYTRAGLDIKFRPDKTKRTKRDGKIPMHPDTVPFFQLKQIYSSEEELRRDAHQWETCVKRTRGFFWDQPQRSRFRHSLQRSEGRRTLRERQADSLFPRGDGSREECA
jgi:hypothetical protein